MRKAICSVSCHELTMVFPSARDFEKAYLARALKQPLPRYHPPGSAHHLRPARVPQGMGRRARAGEADSGALRLDFDRRVMLRFHGSAITSDCGLLAYRELDDVLALTTSGGERLAEARTGRNRRHLLVGLLRQSVFGRLAGYEDVNDADSVVPRSGDALG